MGDHDAKNFCPSLVGSMSQGAAGNPTVAMVEAAFRHHALPWRYVNMEVAPADLAAARSTRAAGRSSSSGPAARPARWRWSWRWPAPGASPS